MTRQERIEGVKRAMLADLEAGNYHAAFCHADTLRGTIGQGRTIGQCDGSLTFDAAQTEVLLHALYGLATIVE